MYKKGGLLMVDKTEELIDRIQSLGLTVNRITVDNRRENEDKDLAKLKTYEDKYNKGTKEAYKEYINLDEEGETKALYEGSYEYDLGNWVMVYRYYLLKGFDESRVN